MADRQLLGRLQVHQALWAMSGLATPEATLGEKFDRVHEAGFDGSAKWKALFRAWWRQGFDAWRSRHAAGASNLIFLCELGPPDYALTDATGRELSDRWAESLILKQWAKELWAEVARGHG